MDNSANNAQSTSPSTRTGTSVYGIRGNSLRGLGVSILNHRKLGDIREYAIRKSNESGLPGQVDGPRDAYRHALLAGELVRELGKENALAMLDHHEASTRNGARPNPERTAPQKTPFSSMRYSGSPAPIGPKRKLASQ